MAQATVPTECPFGTGAPFDIVVPADVVTSHGNVSVPAGPYRAWESNHGGEGDVTIWSTAHYTGSPMWTGLAPWHWHFPGEDPRPLPDHDCIDHARSGVVDGIYCGICMAVLG